MSNNGRVVQGTVVSSKMEKSAVVKLERRVKHPIYKKIVTRTTKVRIHDPENSCSEGDVVSIQETPKVSKTKSWILLNIIEKAS